MREANGVSCKITIVNGEDPLTQQNPSGLPRKITKNSYPKRDNPAKASEIAVLDW